MKVYVITACILMLATQSCTKTTPISAPKSTNLLVRRLDGEDEDQRIKTKVTDITQQPVPNVRVELTNGEDTMLKLTDSFGEADFTTQFTGSWNAYFFKPGYNAVDTLFVNAEDTTYINITMVTK